MKTFATSEKMASAEPKILCSELLVGSLSYTQTTFLDGTAKGSSD